LTALADAVRHHRAEHAPPPVWSLIVTVFGDMALPRGGQLSTEGIIRILGLTGVTPAAVRTALSRLVADGWLEGLREGRRSSHRMTQHALHETRAASRRIYALPQKTFDGRFEIAMLLEGAAAERQALRADLLAAGFGALQQDSLIRPTDAGRPAIQRRQGLVVMADVRPDPADIPLLVSAAYDLDGMAARHAEFSVGHRRLLASVDAGTDPESALAARLLLVHGWRRLVLRDPALPLPLLPPAMRERPLAFAVGHAYAALFQASEASLDALAGPAAARREPIGRFDLEI
jgi:phenylacetic acid degradation operon negative regulatory protein